MVTPAHVSALINRDIASNMLADLYFWVGTVAIFGLVTVVVRWFRARRVADFFGLDGSQTDVPVYISHIRPSDLEAAAAEAAGSDVSRPRRGYQGPLISQREVDGFLRIRALVEGPIRFTRPGLAGLIERRLIVRGVSLSVADGGNFAPRSGQTTFITLGTGKYNQASQAVLTSQRSFARFDYDNRPDRVGCRTFYLAAARSGNEHDFEPRNGRAHDDSRSYELGLIQRIHDRSSGGTVFLCCGLNATSTFAAADYLATHWRRLHREFGPPDLQDFCVLLVVQGPGADDDSTHPSSSPVVARRVDAKFAPPLSEPHRSMSTGGVNDG